MILDVIIEKQLEITTSPDRGGGVAMKTKRINSNGNFAGLVEAIMAFDHHPHDRGVVQCIILEGGRVITGCVTTRKAEESLPLGSSPDPAQTKKIEAHVWDLLELGRSREFVLQMDGMLPVLWQISD